MGYSPWGCKVSDMTQHSTAQHKYIILNNLIFKSLITPAEFLFLEEVTFTGSRD